jgi:hypothetical protein
MTTLHEQASGDPNRNSSNDDMAHDALSQAMERGALEAAAADAFGPVDSDAAMKLIMPAADADTAPRRTDGKGSERREHRRHEMEHQGIEVERWDGRRRVGKPFGQIVDLSAGGVRIRTDSTSVRPDQQIRLRLELPDYAGISPFVQSAQGSVKPKREWVGWMSVCRVSKSEKQAEIAGRLVDMDEMDRGMLGLYLSTQPLAA